MRRVRLHRRAATRTSCLVHRTSGTSDEPTIPAGVGSCEPWSPNLLDPFASAASSSARARAASRVRCVTSANHLRCRTHTPLDAERMQVEPAAEDVGAFRLPEAPEALNEDRRRRPVRRPANGEYESSRVISASSDLSDVSVLRVPLVATRLAPKPDQAMRFHFDLAV